VGNRCPFESKMAFDFTLCFSGFLCGEIALSSLLSISRVVMGKQSGIGGLMPADATLFFR